jgi:hypothetical protein
MKQKAKNRAFLKELQNLVSGLRNMKPGETHILNINANFGRYQLVIGPQKEDAANGDHSIEINGEIDHLFVTPDEVRAQPSRDQVKDNMKGTVIMKGLEIHLHDPNGDGEHLTPFTNGDKNLVPRQCINLAGEKGENLIETLGQSETSSLDAYRIVQEDILKALKQNRKKSLERVS